MVDLKGGTSTISESRNVFAVPAPPGLIPLLIMKVQEALLPCLRIISESSHFFEVVFYLAKDRICWVRGIVAFLRILQLTKPR